MSLRSSTGIADAIRYTTGPTLLRARWIVPVDMPPIEDGEIVIEDGIITRLGKPTGSTAFHDLGNAAIIPGFVNAHARMEHTAMRGLLEDMAFFPWVRTLNSLKTHMNLEEWNASATLGAAEMLASGVTTVADASDSGTSLSALSASGQRGIVYREVTGIEKTPSVETTISVLNSRLVSMRAQLARTGADQRIKLGVSPHAPFSVSPELYSAVAHYAEHERMPRCIRFAESTEEELLVREGDGPFAEMLARRGIAWHTPGVSSTAYLDACGALTSGTALVHSVHVGAEDAALLKERQCTIIHCPKSDGKFGAGVAPVRVFLDAGLPVGLGTDSVASSNVTDMFEEMRFAVLSARARGLDTRALTTREALYMATLGGATALGMDGEIGSISRGKKADLCAVRLDGLHVTPTADDNPVAALVYGCHASDVMLTMVGGRVLYEGGWHVLLDVSRLRHLVTETRKRLRREVARSLGGG